MVNIELKVASMFAGIGCIDLGFEQSGFKIIWANDNDKAACDTYRYNFNANYLTECNIKKIKPESLSNFDVSTAGFLCQSFSISGNPKGFDDARGTLFFEIARIARDKRPQIIFLDNVNNLLEHNDRQTFLVIYNTLCELGYYVR